jgi:GTP 3',8-cyclase
MRYYNPVNRGPEPTMPTDAFNRTINYLRISLTDHCNLRCLYCMPIQDLKFAASDQILSAREIERVVQAAAEVGFTKIRLTGGEPALRSDLVGIVARIAAVQGLTDVTLTTNGILLPPIIDDLVAAGLTRINIHVDTLNPDRLKRLMRFGTVETIMRGIHAADASGLKPLKLNAVVCRGFNDEDVASMARLTIENDWHVRFIELMPLGGGECAGFSLSQFVPSAETQARIESEFGPLTLKPNTDPADEARNHRIRGAKGVVGFISPVSQPYCGTCNRMRLTADGKLHLCLLNDDEIDVKPALRNATDPSAVQRILHQAVREKPTGHRLKEGVSTEQRGMFQIGG